MVRETDYPDKQSRYGEKIKGRKALGCPRRGAPTIPSPYCGFLLAGLVAGFVALEGVFG
jgi:hypothetical protein